MSRKENLPRIEINAGLPLHFLLLLKKSANSFLFFFFITYGNTTEDIKQRFEQNYYMTYCSIQNVLAVGIKRRKIEDQVNQIVPFYQGDLVKEKMTSPLKVSGVMINAGATTIDSVILFFTEFISMVKNKHSLW